MAAASAFSPTMQQETYELSELANGRERRTNRAAAGTGEASTTAQPSPPRSPPWSFKQFWTDNVNCVVDFEKCRDHLGFYINYEDEDIRVGTCPYAVNLPSQHGLPQVWPYRARRQCPKKLARFPGLPLMQLCTDEAQLTSVIHYEALERTFLAYLRTALMSAIVGTLVAQLFVLEDNDDGFGYLVIGRPLATLCFVFSICTVLVGTCRTWRHQQAMIHGKALTGGPEIVVLAAISLVTVCIFFGLLVALDVVKGRTHEG